MTEKAKFLLRSLFLTWKIFGLWALFCGFPTESIAAMSKGC